MAKRLAARIPVRYSFPMLGTTLHHKIHNIASQPSQQQREAMLGEVAAGIQWNSAAQGPLRLGHLERAYQATHTDDFLGLLCLPVLRECKELSETILGALREEQAQAVGGGVCDGLL